MLQGVVEADTTFLSPKKPRKGNPRPKKEKHDIVLGMIERGGKLRMIPIADEKVSIIEPILQKNIDQNSVLQTDSHVTYDMIGQRNFVAHRMINHIEKYVEGDNHTQHIENAFSLLERGIYVGIFDQTINKLARGKALTYKMLPKQL